MNLKRVLALAVSAAMLLMSCSCTVELVSGRPESDDTTSYYYDDNYDYSSDVFSDVSSDAIKMGSDKVGWITIDDSFYKFYDTAATPSDTRVQYCQGPYDILTLNVFENIDAKTAASSFMANLENDSEASGVTGARVKVGNKYDAYQVYCYYENSKQFFVVWLIDSPSGNKVYYIAAEFLGDNADFVDYVETYQMPE